LGRTFQMYREQLFNDACRHSLPTDAFQIHQLPVIQENIDSVHKKMILSACARPELQPLVRSVTFKVINEMNVPFRVPSADQVDLNPDILRHNSLTALFLRHALEIALWQSKMSGYAPLSFFLSIAVLSANTTKAYWNMMIEREQRFCLKYMPVKFQHIFESIKDTDFESFFKNEKKENIRLLIKELLRLQDMENVHDSALTKDVFDEADRFVKQGLFIAAPSEYLIAQGGDNRLKIDKVSGLNGYGCSPKPRPWAVTFASSTATSISNYAFWKVELVRQGMIEAVCRNNINDYYNFEIESIRSKILEVFGLRNIRGAEIVLTTSGTDAELFAVFLSSCENDAPLMNILVGPEETGSGIPLAASGRHFAENTPLGNSVLKGEAVEGLPTDRIRLVEVPVRNYDGTYLKIHSIDSRVKTLASKAIADGSRVLVHIVEGSKTGLSAPSLSVVKDLKNRYGSSLDVIVDACQLRTGRKRLKQYLESGFMVSITGSKFYTGPPFSGALILPSNIARRIKNGTSFPLGFKDYFTVYDIPESLNTKRSSLKSYKNIGLLLRWEAALWEMAAFQVVSDKHKYLIFALFGESIREYISANPDLELVPAPASERWKLPDGEEWDWLPTIFTFTMSRIGPRGIRIPIYIDDAKKIYHWLNMDISGFIPNEASEEEKHIAGKRYHIGQPLKIALIGDKWIGALRISAGARLVSGVCLDPELGKHFAERLSREIGDACSALDKISIIIKYLDYIEHHSRSEDPNDNSEYPYLI